MLRKVWTIGFAGVLAVVALGGVTTAFASSNITQPETFVLDDTIVKSGYVDVGKPGNSIGDSFMFADSLTDPADGSSVGKLHGQCEFQVKGWTLCTAGAFITDRGEIMFQGFVQFSNGRSIFDMPVIGGTGEFDNVRGSVHVEDVTNKLSKLTFTLIP